MAKRLKRALPIVAVTGALVALVMSILVGPWFGRRTLLADTGETRRVVETTTLAQLLALQPSSLEDASFRDAVDQAQDAPYVAVVWLFAPDGRIVEGNRVFAGRTTQESATDEMRRVLGILPQEALTSEQHQALLAASVMQAEGEHNDVYRHLLREVHGPDDELVGWIGITFDVNPSVGAPGAAYISFILILLLALGAYWLSLPVWVWLDARARGERAWVWAVFVLLGNLVALIAYILARRPSTLSQPVA